MPATAALPPDLAALPPSDREPLALVSLRLDPATLRAVDALGQQLGGPSRAALLRVLLDRGLASVREAGAL